MSKRNTQRRRRRLKTQRTRTVSAPAARTTQIRNGGAMRQLTITHREYIRDVKYAEPSPYLSQYEVNPGIDEAFPWLSAIATRFESYRFNSLVYEYIPVVGSITNGAIALVPDYDAADDNSTASKQKLMTYEDTVRGPLWTTLKLRCSTNNLHKQKTLFVRHGDLSTNLDIKTYDALSLSVLVSGASELDGKTVGELWVSYSITLLTPQLEPEPPEVVSFSSSTNTDIGDPFQKIELAGQAPLKKVAGVSEPDYLTIDAPGDFLLTSTGTTETNEPLTGVEDFVFTQLSPVGQSVYGVIANMVEEKISGSFANSVYIKAANDVSVDRPLNIRWPGLIGGVISVIDKITGTFAPYNGKLLPLPLSELSKVSLEQPKKEKVTKKPNFSKLVHDMDEFDGTRDEFIAALLKKMENT